MNGRSGSQYFLRCTLRNGQALPQECFVSTDDIPKTRYLMILIPHMDDQAGSMERRRGSKPACGVSGTQKRKVTKNKKKVPKAQCQPYPRYPHRAFSRYEVLGKCIPLISE